MTGHKLHFTLQADKPLAVLLHRINAKTGAMHTPLTSTSWCWPTSSISYICLYKVTYNDYIHT